jgi:hypothetical protein
MRLISSQPVAGAAAQNNHPQTASSTRKAPVHESPAPALIHPGTMVLSWDLQQVGPVRTIVYDATSGLPARLIVQLTGDAASTVTVPVRCIERIMADEVYLNLSLEQLPRA